MRDKKKCRLYEQGAVYYQGRVRCLSLGEDDKCTIKGVVRCPYWEPLKENSDAKVEHKRQ
jgi:hypothetical protein